VLAVHIPGQRFGMPERAEFLAMEGEVDARLGRLAIWSWPLTTVLCKLFMVVNSLFGEPNAVRFGSARPEAGAALVSRLSYLTAYLANCPVSGGGVEDAINNTTLDQADMIKAVLTYGHFCELVPEVRRAHYSVAKTERGFMLSRSDDGARAEERDVLMTELSLPFELRRGPDHRKEIFRHISPWATPALRDLNPYLRASYDHYLVQVIEGPQLPREIYETCFGFSRDALRSVRAFLLAVADVAIAMSFATQAHARDLGSAVADFVFKKSLKWAVLQVQRDDFLQHVSELTGIGTEIVHAIVGTFSIEPSSKNFAGAGDGYMPPFVHIDGGLLFSPYAVRLMLHERNLLYVLNKQNREMFDRIASPALEPSLLSQAAEILGSLPGILIAKNVEWQEGGQAGEVDLIAYDSASNSALQVQAKAALPPQGARMTRQVEDHTRVAVAQLTSFDHLPSSARDRICGGALNRRVENPQWTSIALSRSGFGALGAWNLLGDVLPMNVQLLTGTVQSLIEIGNPRLRDFETVMRNVWKGLAERCLLGWEREQIDLFGFELDIPLLQLDYGQIGKAKAALWH
jgi:hypothetical protein